MDPGSNENNAIIRFLAANGWQSAKQAAEAMGLKYETVIKRLAQGWPPEQAFEFDPRPVHSSRLTEADRKLLIDSNCRTIAEIARLHRRSVAGVHSALTAGRSLREALRDPYEVTVLGRRFRGRAEAYEHFGVTTHSFNKWYRGIHERSIDGVDRDEWLNAFTEFLHARGIKGRIIFGGLPEPMLWGWRFNSWTAAYEYWTPAPYMPGRWKTLMRLRNGGQPENIFLPARQHWQIERNLVSPDGRRIYPDGRFVPGPIGERLQGYIDRFQPIGAEARQQWARRTSGA